MACSDSDSAEYESGSPPALARKQTSNTNKSTRVLCIAHKDVQNLNFISLKHPKTGDSGSFLLFKDCMLEVQKANLPKRSWFVDDNVQKDGGFYMATRCDPLFVLLPLLDKARNKTAEHDGRFVSLEQVLEGSGVSVEQMTCFPGFLDELSAICDEKDAMDTKFYRLNCAKVLSWLRTKVERVAAHCMPKVDDGSFMAATEKERMAYGSGVVGEYLPAAWMKKLLESFGLEAKDLIKRKAPEPERPSWEKDATAKKASPASQSATPTMAAAAQPKKKAKTQSKTANIDTKGMRSLSSFFSKPK